MAWNRPFVDHQSFDKPSLMDFVSVMLHQQKFGCRDLGNGKMFCRHCRLGIALTQILNLGLFTNLLYAKSILISLSRSLLNKSCPGLGW